MNERELNLLLEAGALKSIQVIAQGSLFHVEAKTAAGCKVVMTGRGEVRQWRSIDSCAKWLCLLGFGLAMLRLEQYISRQAEL